MLIVLQVAGIVLVSCSSEKDRTRVMEGNGRHEKVVDEAVTA